jgi:hypothetical protein
MFHVFLRRPLAVKFQGLFHDLPTSRIPHRVAAKPTPGRRVVIAQRPVTGVKYSPQFGTSPHAKLLTDRDHFNAELHELNHVAKIKLLVLSKFNASSSCSQTLRYARAKLL